MRIQARIPYVSGLLLLAAGFLPAGATPLGGLTVAVSADHQTLVAAGSSRTFYRLDPATLEVRERVWNGLSITQMAFSRDGSVLAASDAASGGNVTLYDAATLQRKTTVQNCEVVAFFPGADVFAGIEGHRRDPARLVIHGLADGMRRASIPITPRRAVIAVAMSVEGTLAAVLYEGLADPNEERATPDSSLRGFERVVAQQQSDGRTSLVEFYEVPSGTLLASHTVYYSVSGQTRAVLLDGSMIVVNGSNQNAVIGPDGSVRMFACATSSNYGFAFSSDHRAILTGGLAQIALTSAEDFSSQAVSVRERLPSWPEYFRGFAGHATGLFYGATDGYRVFVIDRNGGIRLERPVF